MSTYAFCVRRVSSLRKGVKHGVLSRELSSLSFKPDIKLERPRSMLQLSKPQCRRQSLAATPIAGNDVPPSSPSATKTVSFSGGPRDQSKFRPRGPASTPTSRERDARHNRTTVLHPVSIEIDGNRHNFSPILLRDLCRCPRCVDSSTQQKHFSTADIPADIKAKVESAGSDTVTLQWTADIPGYEDHVSELPITTLKNINTFGTVSRFPPRAPKVLWKAEQYDGLSDIDFQSYMSDDRVLLKALQQLHTYGLLFVTNSPESEESVSTIAERIGPLKTTFYGKTWDVRSVPEAKNVAYTAQNLGFHMDLMYLKQPPHLQLLHCIRSSSAGGASLFMDSYRAAFELLHSNPYAFTALSRNNVTYHYDHPGSQYYAWSRPVVELKNSKARLTGHMIADELRGRLGHFADFVEAISWSPPFQGPFGSPKPAGEGATMVSVKIQNWHAAAKEYNALVEAPDGIYQRLMKPGDCVIFDNRRVLHARKAFEVGDVGKERWLRGAYIDKDPYDSKTRVLTEQLEQKRI